MRALQIVDWNRHFETCESKRIGKLSWVAIPNSMEGRGYLRLTRHKSAVSTIAGWYAIVQIGSKMPHRGLLAKVDGPLSAADLSDISRLPEDMFQRAIEVLLEPEIGWLHWVEFKWVNGEPVFGDGTALPPAGRDLHTGQDLQDRPFNKEKGPGARKPGPSGDDIRDIQLAGGTVYGKDDPNWQGLLGDYPLEQVLKAMAAMKRERDGSQEKAGNVRKWIGKHQGQIVVPGRQQSPANSRAQEIADKQRSVDEENTRAFAPLERIDAYLSDPETPKDIQDAIYNHTTGRQALENLRAGKRTALMLGAFLRIEKRLRAIAHPAEVKPA